MTNAEMKKSLKQLGVKDADIKKVEKDLDAEKLSVAVEKAKSPDEAIKAIAKACPSINAKELKKRYEFVSGQSAEVNKEVKKLKKPMQLTGDELENVAGGSIGDWFSKNWKGILIGLAVGLVVGAVTGGAGLFVGSGASAIQTAGVMTSLAHITGGALAGSMGAASFGIVAGSMAVGAIAGGAVGGVVQENM